MPSLLEHLPFSRQRTPCAEKNDKLGWTHGLSVRWSGLTIGLRCNRAEVIPQLQSALPAEASPCQERESDILLSVIQGGEAGKGRKNYHLVYNHWTRVARTMNWEQALGAFRDSLDESRAFLAKEHILMNCLRAEAEGKSVVLCPTPQVRGQILEAYPESESWIDALSLHDRSPVILIVDEATSEFSQTLTPGQAALELVRHSGSARNQPRQVLDEMSKLAHRIRMYRVPANQSRADYETFLRGRTTDG